MRKSRWLVVLSSSLVVGAWVESASAQKAAAADALSEKLDEQTASINAQEVRIKALEQKLEAMKKKLAQEGAPSADKSSAATTSANAATAAAATAPGTPPPPSTGGGLLSDDPRKGLVITGYTQAEYESHQDSESQLRAGGGLLNQDRFLIRRGRIKLEREWQWASLMVEFDANTTNGPVFNLWHAEASLQYRGDNAGDLPPIARLTMGIFDTPFGAELLESPRTRWFTERSWGSRQLFPSEPDVGVKVSGALGWFRYWAAVLNGEPYGTPFQFRSPQIVKDVALRFAAVSKPTPTSEFRLGVSVLDGHGFAPGSDATKASVSWHDDNENGVIDPGELTGVPGQAAVASQDFRHWAIGADALIGLQTAWGWSQAWVEIALASNLDRGLYTANPVNSGGVDYRELNYVIGLQQDIGKWGVVGLRTDYYDPNSDYLGYQNGNRIKQNLTVRNVSPMIGFAVPGGHARVVFQYDFNRNHFAINALGVPSNMAANAWTIRIQGEL